MNYLKTKITITANPISLSTYVDSKAFKNRLAKLDLQKSHVNRPQADTIILVLEERTKPGIVHDLIVQHQIHQAEKLSLEAGAYLILCTNINNGTVETICFNHGIRLDSSVAA